MLLFEALEDLQRIARDAPVHGRIKGVHADLSPSNIIVSDADGAFKLIDLGRNYLYTHTITGTSGAESSYIAPEVKAGDSEIARADLYSLGRLLILFGTGRASTDGVVPDIFYMRAVQLARFIEDLIDADPARRLLLFGTGTEHAFSFGELKSGFLAELETVQAAEQGESDLRVETGWRALRELLRPLAGDPGREWRLWRMHHQQSGRPEGYRRPFTNWLLAWSLVSALIWAVTNSTVITWLLRDFDLDWGNKLVELVQHLDGGSKGFPIVDSWRHSDYRLPDWRANLPARMVGLSYAIAAPKYYQTLFSGLTPLAIGWRAGALSRAGPGDRGDHPDHGRRALPARPGDHPGRTPLVAAQLRDRAVPDLARELPDPRLRPRGHRAFPAARSQYAPQRRRQDHRALRARPVGTDLTLLRHGRADHRRLPLRADPS